MSQTNYPSLVSPAYDREDMWTAIQLKSRKAIENHKDEIRRDPHLSSEGRTVIAFIDDVFDRAWLSDKIDRYLRLELGIPARHVVDVLQFLSDNGILVKRDFVTLSATSDQVRSASDKVLAEFKPADGISLLTIDKATPTNIIADAQEVQSKSGIVPVPKDSLTHPNNVTVCVMDKDQVVACTSVVDAGSARYGRKGWYTVMGTAVHPDYRGQLLGRVVKAACLNTCVRTRPAERIVTVVDLDNIKSIRSNLSSGLQCFPDYFFVFARITDTEFNRRLNNSSGS